MKKILTGTIIGCALLTSGTFAAQMEKPMLISMPMPPIETSVEKIEISESDLIIRNNIISPEYDYNSTHYYTTKITTKDIVIPKEIQSKAKKVYFLVEEGRSNIMYAKGLQMDALESTPVSDKYNYKIVDYTEGKKEYIFKNLDLVKDF